MKQNSWQADAPRFPSPPGEGGSKGKQEKWGKERKNEALSSRPAAGTAMRFAHQQSNMGTALKGKTWDEARMFWAAG